MMKTIAEINEKIQKKKAVVVVAWSFLSFYIELL